MSDEYYKNAGIHELTHAVRELTQALCSLKSELGAATKCDLKEIEEKIMSKFTEWADAQEADQAEIKSTLEGISAGVANLEKLITDFQNSPGTLTTEDQARLDAIQAASKALVKSAKDIKTDAPA